MPATAWLELMERQHHVFTREQAQEFGVSRHQLAWRVRNGYWQRVYPRVYADSPAPLSRTSRLTAALLWLGEGAVLSHTTAAAEWGLQVPSDPQIHLTVPRRRPQRPPAGLVLHRCTVMGDPAARGGLLMTSLEHSIIDAAALLRRRSERRAVVADAFQRRMTTRRRLLTELSGVLAHPHRAELLETIELAAGGSHSVAELDYLLFFRLQGLPEPLRQYPLLTPIGKLYLDLCLPDLLINIEIDGRDGHLSDSDRQRDLRRDACSVALGWLVLRLTKRRLDREPEVVAAEIRAVIDRRRADEAASQDGAAPCAGGRLA